MFVSTNQFIYSLVINFLPRWQPAFAPECSKVRTGQEFLHGIEAGHLFASNLAFNELAHEIGKAFAPARRFGIGPARNRIIKGDGYIFHRNT